MLVTIKVVPNAKLTLVKKEKDYLKVYTNSPAFEGQANEALVKLLAKHFQTSRKNILLLKGDKSRIKLVEIIE